MFGVFREGNDDYDVTHGEDWTAFNSTWSSNSAAGLRLVDVETLEIDGTRTYSGVYREGADAYGL